MHFGITEKPMRDSILSIAYRHNNAGFISKVSEQIATESVKYRLYYIVPRDYI